MIRKELNINGAKSSIIIGESITNLQKYLPNQNCAFITDEKIFRLYSELIPKKNLIVIPAGEKSKSLETISEIIKQLLDLGIDRHSFLLGIGGGVICDIVGFVASIYMRGIDFGFVPTSLLSQVDASVGGKNGVNLMDYKNIIGVFNQPKFVLCDIEMLKTLPEDDYISGFGEIIKHAIIADAKLFEFLESNHERLLQKDLAILETLIFRNIDIKSEIVIKDEKESGERRKLNFGHTFAHGLENILNIKHGAAVSLGMAIAAKISAKMGLADIKDINRISALLEKYHLPISAEYDSKQICKMIGRDKKKTGESVNFVFLKNIGEVEVKLIEFQELEKLFYDLR